MFGAKAAPPKKEDKTLKNNGSSNQKDGQSFPSWALYAAVGKIAVHLILEPGPVPSNSSRMLKDC